MGVRACSNIHFAVAQGTLLWQPVKFGRCSQTSRGTTLLWHLTTDWPIINPLSKGSMAIIGSIMYKAGEIPSNNLGVYALKCTIYAVIQPQFDDDLHSSRWRSATVGRSQFLFLRSHRHSFLYIL